MLDFLKIDDDFWDFPFYRGKPVMPKFVGDIGNCCAS